MLRRDTLALLAVALAAPRAAPGQPAAPLRRIGALVPAVAQTVGARNRRVHIGRLSEGGPSPASVTVKRIEMLKEIAPKTVRLIAVVPGPGATQYPIVADWLRHSEKAARALKLGFRFAELTPDPALCCAHSRRRTAARSAGGATDEIRDCCQCRDREDAQPDDSRSVLLRVDEVIE